MRLNARADGYGATAGGSAWRIFLACSLAQLSALRTTQGEVLNAEVPALRQGERLLTSRVPPNLPKRRNSPPHDQVIQQLHLNMRKRLLDPPRETNIRRRRSRIAARMIVCD